MAIKGKDIVRMPSLRMISCIVKHKQSGMDYMPVIYDSYFRRILYDEFKEDNICSLNREQCDELMQIFWMKMTPHIWNFKVKKSDRKYLVKVD